MIAEKVLKRNNAFIKALLFYEKKKKEDSIKLNSKLNLFS